MENLIDVHCHLDFDAYEKDLDEVIERARDVGVRLIVTSGVNPTTNLKALEIEKKYPDIVKVSFGVYPVDAIMEKIGDAGMEGRLREVETFNLDEQLKWIEENYEKCVAVGEVGLDYKIVEGHNEEQREAFQKIIDLALRIDKPLIIHSRKGELDAIDMMESSGCKKVIMHCFMGKKSLIKRAAELEWYFSVPAIIGKLEHFKMLVEMVPLEQLLTETDGPFLSPVVGRGSEPADVSLTVKEIAKIKGLGEAEVASQIFNNARKVFGLF